VIGFLISLIVIGAIAGFLARLIVPGPDPMSVVATIGLGLVGSLIGGFLGYLLFHKDGAAGPFQTSGLLGSVLGSVIALLVYRRLNRSGVRR
jgi:uncharacterized membrane protein YeaQ/YmgE (transglycosylase-associated protein family)